MEIQFLQAEYGDANIIKTKAGDKPYTIVVDGGPESTAEEISRQLQALEHIDLMVLTHFDEDHIMGLIKYVERYKGQPLPVDKFWCNCAQNIDLPPEPDISDAGYENANTLAAFLRAQQQLNPSFEWREDIQIGTSLQDGDLRIDVISPSPEILSTLKEEYNDYISKHPQIDEEEDDLDIASYRVETDAKTSIEDLSKTDTPRSVNLWNKASIAFLLRAEGKQVLLTGDADAEVMAKGLESIVGIELPVDIDLMKAAHHGSRNNVSKRFLSLIRCHNFAFTTNGGTRNWYHPDRKTMALMVNSSNRDKQQAVHFFFNYSLKTIQKRTGNLLSEEEKEQYNCEMQEQRIIEL